MFRELLNKFSGGQLTAIVITAMLVPGAVTAAVTFQPVTIVDPNTGKQSSVDASRRLVVYDPIAGYRNNPANFIDIIVSNNNVGCAATQYAIPSGKALVITAVSGWTQPVSTTVGFSGLYIYGGPNCLDPMLATYINPSNGSTNTFLPVSMNFNTGIAVKSGGTVSVYSSNNNGYTLIHGYLVPAAAVPALSSADVAAEPKQVTAAEVAAKMKKLTSR